MIPYGRQQVDEADIKAVVEVLRGEWLTTGPMVDRLEQALREWTGGVPTVAVSSGTAALHTAYAAAGIGPGDEVITPAITFVATQAAAVLTGARPVVVDVEADTANIDPVAVEAAISPRTAAIVAVDYAGHPADLVRLRAIADRYKLLLIEDAAHSLGSTLGGRLVGSLADVTTFSFFPTKNITTGEGGAVAALDPQVLQRAREFSRQGLVRDPRRFELSDDGPWHQEVHEFGLNYRLPDVLAALGVSQLGRLSDFKARRAQLKALYDECLVGCDGARVPTQRPGADPVWHLYPLRVPAPHRRAVFEGLRESGVNVQVNYLPVYRHPAFSSLVNHQSPCARAETFYSEEISLPMWVGLSDDEVVRICSTVRGLLQAARYPDG